MSHDYRTCEVDYALEKIFMGAVQRVVYLHSRSSEVTSVQFETDAVARIPDMLHRVDNEWQYLSSQSRRSVYFPMWLAMHPYYWLTHSVVKSTIGLDQCSRASNVLSCSQVSVR